MQAKADVVDFHLVISGIVSFQRIDAKFKRSVISLPFHRLSFQGFLSTLFTVKLDEFQIDIKIKRRNRDGNIFRHDHSSPDHLGWIRCPVEKSQRLP